MTSKTIKISAENYVWLLHLAAEMQKNYIKPISFDEVIGNLKNCGKSKKDLMSYAGAWEMSDREAREFLESGKKGWKKWKIPSV